MFPQRLIFISNWYIDVLWIISTLFWWGPAITVGWGGGGRRHPIYYIIISPNFGCKWVKYSILWCQPCQNSFIWTYFPIAYTNKTKLSVLKHFLNMTDFDTYSLAYLQYKPSYETSKMGTRPMISDLKSESHLH